MLGIRVPDDDVGVATLRQFAFARIEAEQARRSGRDELDKTVQRYFACVHAVMEEKLKAYFAPSKPGRAKSSIDRSRYCGQVSAKIGTPRSRAARTSLSASSEERC